MIGDGPKRMSYWRSCCNRAHRRPIGLAAGNTRGAHCERKARILPAAPTSVRAVGRVKRIEHYHGDSGAPKILGALENKIDATAGSERWIGGGERSSRDGWDSMRR